MRHKPKILIVEDNTLNHPLYEQVFKAAGFDVVIKNGADENFTDVVDEIKPDIISMDLMIEPDDGAPRRDGFWAMSELKRDIRTHHIPIMVLTSFFEEAKVRKAKELGAVDFLNTAGETLAKTPEHYLRYLKDPKRYVPVHALLRK